YRHNSKFLDRRGKLQFTHSITERPIEANKRSRVGDWELDTVRGKKGGQVLVTLVDRCSRKLFVQRANSERNIDINIALEKILDSVNPNDIKTITPDRGKEFSLHAAITNKYSVEFYFADAYSPWQRGTNENSNGLLREYVPKGQEIANYTDEYLQRCVFQINNRPRKLFNWKSAQDVYNEKCST
ncbi:IS30 family transposase, partial [Weissella minor]|uniref:IS30 family transposase n=1 Tax=Weissella minor TaxID=1620 RepID=UPI001BB07C49